MATVPATHSFIDGLATSSEQNTYVRDPINFLLKPPLAELRQIVLQTLTTAVGAALTFTASDVDTDYLGNTGHSNSVNTSRYTAVFPGWYEGSGVSSFAANAAGRRANWWAVNGTQLNSGQVALAATAALDCEVPARGKRFYLNVGDYVELFAYQESGGNLNTYVLLPGASGVSIKWVSN